MPRLAAICLLCCGAALLTLDLTARVAIRADKAIPSRGNEYAINALPASIATGIPGDDNQHPARSALQLLEDGRPIGIAHSVHEDIRVLGGGRFSHWGKSLLFSASDNTDPRANGRAYAVQYPIDVPPWIGYLALIAGLVLLFYADRKAWVRDFGESVRAFGQCAGHARSAPLTAWMFIYPALFAALLAVTLSLGFDRSGWILITQPLEATHSSNSLLGFSLVRDGGVLHKENYSAILQVAFFSGADVTPDLYFRRPVYAFLAALLAPLFGVVSALVLVNLIAWVLGAWLCHRFARNFYGDRDAARWAGLLALGGIGFVLHALDLSAHLLSFVFYMAGVVLIHESQVWRSEAGWRVHLGIAVFLMLACLQYNTGIALVAAYFLVAIRHNRWRHVLAACALALLMQPLWGWIVGSVFEWRHGTALPDLSRTEVEYLQNAIQGWSAIFRKPLGEMLAAVGGLLASFLFFEMPLITIVGAAGLVADARRDADGRARLAFALPFICLPVLAALAFAPAALARGYLVYGISIFFFASCGAVLAKALRRKPDLFFLLACLLVVLSLAWSTAHFANALGPGKAYFLGMESAFRLFAAPGWEAASLTGLEPVPRLFGGSGSLAQAGLSSNLPAIVIPPATSVVYALLSGALFVVLAGAGLVLAAGRQWRLGFVAGVVLLAALALCGRLVDNNVTVAMVDKAWRIAPGSAVMYEVDLSDRFRARLAEGLRQGDALALYTGAYAGPVPPEVRIGGRGARLTKKTDFGIWLLDASDVLAELEPTGSGKLVVTFTGSDDTWLGGWQRNALPGRRLTSNGATVDAVALPELELRLVRDGASLSPRLVGF